MTPNIFVQFAHFARLLKEDSHEQRKYSIMSTL